MGTTLVYVNYPEAKDFGVFCSTSINSIMACDLIPLSAFQSTNLNNKIDSYTDIGNRILRNLGAPLNKIEATQEMMGEFISQATEMYTKYQGFTKEYLVFRSDLYSPVLGVRLDHLFTMAQNMRDFDNGKNIMEFMDTHYVIMQDLSQGMFVNTPLQPAITQNLKRGDIIDVFDKTGGQFEVGQRGQAPVTVQLTETFMDTMLNIIPPDLSSQVIQSDPLGKFSVKGEQLTGTTRLHRLFDYDLMDYRKAINVIDYVEGSSSGINTLFSIEQALAQQTFFSYQMGNYGFDLVSWHIVQEWIELRQKVLCTRKNWMFDPRTQYFKLYPNPSQLTYGIIEAYVERPLRDVVKEPWVQQYALALTKIAVAHVRGKIQGLSLFGGGTVNYNDLMSQGVQEKEKLEKMMFEGATPGMGDQQPASFLIG